mgnify:CR=1 FL=1
MPCQQSGDCCRLFYINLNEEEYRSGRYQTMFQDLGQIDDFELAESAGATILAQNEDGSCIYLKNNLCSIHSIRPHVCRPFFCDSKEPRFQAMIADIAQFRKNKKI